MEGKRRVRGGITAAVDVLSHTAAACSIYWPTPKATHHYPAILIGPGVPAYMIYGSSDLPAGTLKEI